MKKIVYSVIFASLLLMSLFTQNIYAEIVTNTTEGNHLFTSKFEKVNGQSCTAVALSDTSFLTAAHCVDRNNQESYIGKVFPALSGIQTPLSSIDIDKATVYSPRNLDSKKDFAILKGKNPPQSMKYYLTNNAVKIKAVDDLQSLIGKKVYTIGYPKDTEAKYQDKKEGTIQKIDSGVILTDNITGSGSSGGGLYLEETNELIGIVSGKGIGLSHFAPITSDIKNWIDKNK
ncbi:trypsin-like serine protease [Staphylococcus sp. 11007852]|uniref:trypsin-like serine protease n=1 Tax=Staphylococcus sp. 11007852 TaxID=2714543 RepID=UPI001403615C|nr:trypsin-like serine protease [Staphylococcus sp. 11007852]NHM74404.1 trypsin-like serine protease [Staphylococcus sp. 11007852]